MKVNYVDEYKKYSGKFNMEFDLRMFNEAIEKKTDDFYLRFYGWNPRCVSFGRNQKPFSLPEGIDSIVRPTGGRALFHDNEITYAVAGKIPEKYSVIDTYKIISAILIKGFKRLNINLESGGERAYSGKYCMNISTGADICYKNKKFIGSAQYRKQGYFLQHGSIIKDIDPNITELIFNEPFQKDKIATIKDISPDLADEDIIKAIKAEFENYCASNEPEDV